MKAIEILKFGGPGVLTVCERDRPVPKPGEILIHVHAAGINRPDVLQRMGHYPVPPGASDLPGLEVAGTIAAIGDGETLSATHLTIGDSVCALVQGGGYAEYCTAPIAQCLPIPGGLSMVEGRVAARDLLHRPGANVFDRARLGTHASGRLDTLLVQGGTSGIGVTAIQIAKARGHRVFATAGSDDKARACEALGAECGINYRSEDFRRGRQAAHGRAGASTVVLDMVAGGLPAARGQGAGRRRPSGADRAARRRQGRARSRPGPAQTPHGHRFDVAAARRRLQGSHRGAAARARLAAARLRGRQAGGVQVVSARERGRCAPADGEQCPTSGRSS